MFILSAGPQAPAGVGRLPSWPVGLSHSRVCASESGPGVFVLGPSFFLWGVSARVLLPGLIWSDLTVCVSEGPLIRLVSE